MARTKQTPRKMSSPNDQFLCKQLNCDKQFRSSNGLRRHLITVHRVKPSGEAATEEDIALVRKNQTWKKRKLSELPRTDDGGNVIPETAEPTATMTPTGAEAGTEVITVDEERDDEELPVASDETDSASDVAEVQSSYVRECVRRAVAARPPGWHPGGKPRKAYWNEPREVPGAELLTAIHDLPEASAAEIAEYFKRHIDLTEKQTRRIRKRLSDMMAARQSVMQEVMQLVPYELETETELREVIKNVRSLANQEYRRPSRRPFDI